MEIIISDFISWQYCILILLIIIFIIWIFYGGQDNLEYIGLAPLKIGVDASRNVEHGNSQEEESQEEDEDEEPIDNTPKLPKIKKESPFINFYEGGKFPNISLSESEDYSSQPSIKKLVIQTPRTLALGDHTCFKNTKKSKGELLCKQAIEEIYGVPFYCVRPNFLKNPETGRNLELDLYNDDLKIAIERHGKQHYVFPNTFHKTKEEFMNQVRRDQFKVETCDQNGIYLISVPYNIPNDYKKIKEYIEYYLPENCEKRMEQN